MEIIFIVCVLLGERLWPNPPRMLQTIANGISTQQLGQLTWPILKDLAEKQVFTVVSITIQIHWIHLHFIKVIIRLKKLNVCYNLLDFP